MCLIDLKPFKLTGQYVEDLLQSVGITVNKNTVVGDKSALRPSGLRIGSAALTSRGMKELEFRQIAEWINDLVCNPENKEKIKDIKISVEKMAQRFPHPSF